MITIENESEGLKKSIFEFFRMKLPKDYKKLDIDLKIKVEEKVIYIEVLGNRIKESEELIIKGESPHFIIKRFLFDLFSNYKDFDSSFGTLTGVRPLKLISKVFESNSYENSKKILFDKYRINREDIDFLYRVYKNQEKVRNNSSTKNYNVYVHIPFCPSRCLYCSFDTTVENKEKMNLYTKNLIEDIKNYKLDFLSEPNSLYIGGGTPTSIGLNNLEKIIDVILKKFKNTKEFTVECGRIDSLNVEILEMLKNNGVNRISLNPQTFNENVINKLNRTSNENIKYWFDKAREIGFDVINMDLIMGLPGESKESILNSIKKAIEFSPENITIHTLALKNGSKLFENNYINKEDYSDLLRESKTLMLNSSYEPYYIYRQKKSVISSENVGYAKKGYSSIYNIVMMEELENIIGFGLGASTKILDSRGKFNRKLNSKNLEEYLTRR
ncbi:coproporphyrinogen dehydrogenase HemZ [Peptoniphilus sp. AGMB00490]|uniref:Coproporphyrinogen dehydrogenase HemZ n=2 Tax=Peptoniphilus TaxID=162289 RepID=A0ACD6AZ36_9FIRM|nr:MULTISPECIES: coproporphyrinogen dehydrogenase HemZ [Peptoniphilus]NMW84640.1 coproporphyrinogen dehydrogenase HemZ [Peptoniphilus faecalis]OLR64514.1 coproporphyrinogen dehydrogenase HemZ [Peptoniphilus porci]